MSKTLINNMVKITGFHHRIRHEIIERAGGNPFFIEEVVRSLIDHGAVVLKNGRFEVTDKIDTVVIPQTITDVLMARIDRLEEKTRELIKIASVIGRSFFYRIIIEVARTIEDIDRRLGYLKEIQFIVQRKRLEELEYLFKHALAQQTAYESILHQKRKELHLKIAGSIEKVFQNKLAEFYGMLAYHYSNADSLDKAEKYMIMAGEEALKSSASSEALYYYQNAMELYIKKFGQAVDPNKMSELEENIGFAFYGRGYYVEAIEYFTRALTNLGINEPRSRMHIIIRLISNVSIIIKNLYLPTIRKKKAPSSLDNRIMRIILHRGKALTIVDVKKMFIESILFVARGFKADISKSQIYFDALSGMSGLFFYTGISFGISKRILEYARKSVQDEDAAVSLHFYKFVESAYSYQVGNWHREFDESAIDYAVKIGDLLTASVHLMYLHAMHSERGDFETCERIIDRHRNIVDNFDHDYALFWFLLSWTRHLMKKRDLIHALESANDAVELAEKIGMEMQKLQAVGMKLKVQVMLDELDAAKETIEIGETVLRNVYRLPPVFWGHFLTGRFLYDLAILEKSVVLSEKPDTSKLRRAALISGKRAIENSKMVAAHRTDVYRLKGKYHWLVNKEKKALKWWSKSISEGTRLGARPELSRTYMEVGKRLSEPESKYKELNRTSAREYLDMANSMFKEMDLQWDLDELERISVTN
jgi:tetratricopeptide (TPR) repeat protein